MGILEYAFFESYDDGDLDNIRPYFVTMVFVFNPSSPTSLVRTMPRHDQDWLLEAMHDNKYGELE